jgi:hypothetical protein
MAANLQFTPELRELFLEQLRTSPNVSAAARACGIGPGTAYKHRQSDPSFAEAWDEAIEECIDTLEAKLYERATVGYEEAQVYKGQIAMQADPITGQQRPVTVRKFSDNVGMFLLRGRRRRIYGDASSIELSGPGGKPIEMTDTERAKRLDALLAAAAERKKLLEGDDNGKA